MTVDAFHEDAAGVRTWLDRVHVYMVQEQVSFSDGLYTASANDIGLSEDV